MAQGKALSVHVGLQTAQMFGPLSKHSLTRRMEAPMVRQMRTVLRDAIIEALMDARKDRAFPYRTGHGYREMLKGARAFGTRFHDLRGHLLAPSYMVAHERGTTIEPVEAPQLAVPLPAALHPNGQPKLPRPGSWRLHGSFIFKSKKTGRGYIARKTASGDLQLLYVFVDEAQLRKHKGVLNRAWERKLPRLFDKFSQIFVSAITGVNVMDYIEAGEKAGREIKR